MNLPNALTVGRIFLVPLLVVVLLTKFEGRLILGVRKELVGAAIFGLASLTDVLDGYLARRRKQITTLGQLMDPLADKLLITAALVSLVQMDLAPAWMVAVIIGREFAVTALRSIFYARGVPIPASPLGKVKMIAQVVAIIALILGQHGQAQAFSLHRLGQAALWVVVVAALVSAVDYFRRFNLLLNPRSSTPEAVVSRNSTPGSPGNPGNSGNIVPRSISAARDNRRSERRRESA
jgi:CDP-diacylglycerol---glycerol-3-phosphate 3-phosphatidyltransferase